MKRIVFFLAFIMCLAHVYSQTDEEYSTPVYIAPLMPLAPQYPINLTLANQRMLNSPEQLALEAQRNEYILHTHTFPWLGIILGLLCGLAWWLLRQWYAYYEARKPKPSPQVLAQRKALAELKQMKGENLVGRGLYKEFYSELSHTMRNYIQEAFQIPATYQTTEEFLDATAQQPIIESTYRERVGRFLQQADEVKFAKIEPSIQACEKDYHAVQDLIQSSTDK